MVEHDSAQALVVSGFLGSGKTTLVRHLLEEGQRQGIRTAVVSNEFGELGIDEALLADAAADYVELSGGCVCCRLFSLPPRSPFRRSPPKADGRRPPSVPQTRERAQPRDDGELS